MIAAKREQFPTGEGMKSGVSCTRLSTTTETNIEARDAFAVVVTALPACWFGSVAWLPSTRQLLISTALKGVL